jgi:hypothetical protein
MEDSLDERLRKGKLLDDVRDKTSAEPYTADIGRGLNKEGYRLTVRTDGTHVVSTPSSEIELPPVIAEALDDYLYDAKLTMVALDWIDDEPEEYWADDLKRAHSMAKHGDRDSAIAVFKWDLRCQWEEERRRSIEEQIVDELYGDDEDEDG